MRDVGCRGMSADGTGVYGASGVNRYMAKAPKDIKFAPLNKDQEYTAVELMTVYEVSSASPILNHSQRKAD